jgi:hypothetical protein
MRAFPSHQQETGYLRVIAFFDVIPAQAGLLCDSPGRESTFKKMDARLRSSGMTDKGEE